MLKLPKGLKKKKKKSKKDKELFTEEELEQYKRDLRAKQEAAAAKSDAGESDATSDVEITGPSTSKGKGIKSENAASNTSGKVEANSPATNLESGINDGDSSKGANNTEEDEEWAKFKALTSGVDSILHKTQDELDRIKKESFYQRLPSAAEKKRQEEEEAARKEAERLEEERRKAAEFEANRDKLAEAVVELSESEGEDEAEVDDIFATDYIDAIAKGEVKLAVVPDSPDLGIDEGPDPFDTAYAEKVIVGADKAKGDKKLVSLGAAVEVLSGRVDREHALALAKPKRKLRKGIQNLLLSESVDFADTETEIVTSEPQKNLLDELADDVPEPDAPIDLSTSLHLRLLQPKKFEEEVEDDKEKEKENDKEASGDAVVPDLSEFDTLKYEEDDEFTELATESLTKKDEVQVVTEIPLPHEEVYPKFSSTKWAVFDLTGLPDDVGASQGQKPENPSRSNRWPLEPGVEFASDDDEDYYDTIPDDPFNTSYADIVIKRTTALEDDEEFDPRVEEKNKRNALTAPARDLLGGSATDLSQVGTAPIAPFQEEESADKEIDPFDTSSVGALVEPRATELKVLERELLPENHLKNSLSDPDFDPRAEELSPVQKQINKYFTPEQVQVNSTTEVDATRRKSSLSLNFQSKSVGFLVPDQDLLGAVGEGSSNKKPLTPYYAPKNASIDEKESEDPFDTSNVPEPKPTEVELKHIEQDLLQKSTLKHSLSDPDFDPRAPPSPIPAEELLRVKENINTKILTPQESKDLPEETEQEVDPFDTSIAANLLPGKTELKLLENEFLPEPQKEIITGVLDTQTDAQELGLGGKVLTPQLQVKHFSVPEDVDPFDTSIADNLAPGLTEIKLLESELIENK